RTNWNKYWYSMIIPYDEKYVPRLQAIHNNGFPFPNLDSPLYVIKGIALNDNGRLVGGGFVKLISEAILILDNNASTMERSKALKEFFLIGKAKSEKLGLDSWHVFLSKELNDYGEILKKHFGFVEGKSSKYLYL